MSQSVAETQQQLIALLPRFRRFARSLARNPHDADDLVQLAIERGLTRLDQWQPGTRLDSWMYGIIKNAWIDEVRSRQRRDRVFAAEELGQHVADAASEAHIDRLSLEAALAQLPDEQRLAVALVMVEGLAYKEAAAVLEVPIGTVTSRLARGREALEKLLGGVDGGAA
jgi:RNA polymerase sigma-70 factor (ECF subfamily)